MKNKKIMVLWRFMGMQMAGPWVRGPGNSISPTPSQGQSSDSTRLRRPPHVAPPPAPFGLRLPQPLLACSGGL